MDDRLTTFILYLPVLLFSVVAHEYAHGYAALKQGDSTALQLGRLTFNPIKHIDPFMSILMPALLFFTVGFILGGAKPVPVNPRNYRNYRRGDIIVSLAGIATNIVLGFVCMVLIVVCGLIGRMVPAAVELLATLQFMLVFGIAINFILAVFNLLPIPPLDGSHVMKYVLPPAWSLRYQSIGGAGIVILLGVMLLAPGLLRTWLMPAFELSTNLTLAVRGFLLPNALR